MICILIESTTDSKSKINQISLPPWTQVKKCTKLFSPNFMSSLSYFNLAAIFTRNKNTSTLTCTFYAKSNRVNQVEELIFTFGLNIKPFLKFYLIWTNKHTVYESWRFNHQDTQIKNSSFQRNCLQFCQLYLVWECHQLLQVEHL